MTYKNAILQIQQVAFLGYWPRYDSDVSLRRLYFSVSLG